MAIRTCSVANGECTAPAGWSTGAGYGRNTTERAEETCFICGEAVCLKCSSMVEWYGKVVRACDNCKDSYMGRAER